MGRMGAVSEPSAQFTVTVAQADTAIALGSGDVPVLATPRVLAWCETATVAAIQSILEPGETSVGARIELRHLAPTAVGVRVEVGARLVSRDGPRVQLRIWVRDTERELACGEIERVVVSRDAFLAKISPTTSLPVQ